MFLVLELGGAKYLEFATLDLAEAYAKSVVKITGCKVEIFGVDTIVF